jgi:pyruvate dehydrogenase E2 component (dihydrolipoamide acetyltransferase)
MGLFRRFIDKNVALASPLKLTPWRKVAIGTWKTVGDPSVYGFIDFDVTAALAYIESAKKNSPAIRITFTHFVGKAMAEAIKRHPEVNCILRFGRLYPREKVDVFFQVASDTKGEDLSGMTVRDAPRKSIQAIAAEMADQVQVIREKGDPAFKKMKGTMGLIPGFLAWPIINLSGFILYGLNLWISLLGTPKDPFGSVMITNIGSLGLDMAFAPLVPYSRVPMLIVVGAVRDAPVVKDHALSIAPLCRLACTFDHRLIDGMHASHLAKTLHQIFADPVKELGPP